MSKIINKSQIKTTPVEVAPVVTEGETQKFYRIKKKNGFYAMEVITLRPGGFEVLSKSETEEDIFPIIEEKTRVEIETNAKDF